MSEKFCPLYQNPQLFTGPTFIYRCGLTDCFLVCLFFLVLETWGDVWPTAARQKSVRSPRPNFRPLTPRCWLRSTVGSRYILAGKQEHVTHMPSGTMEALQMFNGRTFDRGAPACVRCQRPAAASASLAAPSGRGPFLNSWFQWINT